MTRDRDLADPLPQNIEAERTLLGAIFLNNASLLTAIRYLGTSDFFLDQHKRIFSAMCRLHTEQSGIDLVLLCEHLSKSGDLEAAGGAAYIASLGDGIPRAENVEHYAKIIREKSMLRNVIHLSHRVQKNAFSANSLADLKPLLASLTAQDSQPQKVVGGNGHLSYSLTEFLAAEFPEPEHLVEGLIPRGGTALLVALPHRMKSWFTTALSLASSSPGVVLGTLQVKKPVRTLLIQVEDFPGQLQWRIRQLVPFINCEPGNVRVIPRCGLNLPDEAWYASLLREVEEHKADHVIMDVVRRIFRGDINSPKDTALFLEHIDRLREATNCAVTLVHHENKKDAEIMTAAAGSYNLPGWANVMIQFKRKTQEGAITHVEIEVDNKLAQSPEPMRMVLDLSSEVPIRLEPVEDLMGVQEARDRLAFDWTVRDLAEVLEVHKSNALRRLKKWMATGVAEKISGGKRGRAGGLARYKFVGEGE